MAWLQPRPHISQIPEILCILSEKKQFLQKVLEMISLWCSYGRLGVNISQKLIVFILRKENHSLSIVKLLLECNQQKDKRQIVAEMDLFFKVHMTRNFFFLFLVVGYL